jgi:hypothetical protein
MSEPTSFTVPGAGASHPCHIFSLAGLATPDVIR